MKYYIKGKGKIELDKSSFIAKGGQGAIYAQGDRAYKLYFDAAQMIPEAKVTELAALDHSSIIRPLDLLLDSKNRPAGYSMSYIRDSFPLCRLFTKSFKRKEKVEQDQIVKLVEDFYKTIRFIHERGVLVVDLNEMNFLVNNSFSRVLCIDVDSYQTGSFPAQVIMDSIRDRHTRGFNRNSDWFSWAVVTFQLFIGIHPYKGKHKGGLSLNERMEQNISVFNSAVSVPALCEPFSAIPAELKAWYLALFEQGKRLPPPGSFNNNIRSAVAARDHGLMSSSGAEGRKVTMTLLREFESEVSSYHEFNGLEIVELEESLMVGGLAANVNSPGQVIGLTPRYETPLAVALDDGRARITDLKSGKLLEGEIEADSLMSYRGALYLKCRDQIFELDFIESTGSLKAVPRVAANVVEGAARLFPGLVLQNLLKSCYLTIFPERGKSYQVRLDILADTKVIEAAYDGGLLLVIGYQHGIYTRYLIRFNDDFSDYEVRVEQNISNLEINFLTLPNGIALSFNDDEELELFFTRKGSQEHRVIRDEALKGGRLACRGTEVLLIKGRRLYKISLGK